MELSFASRIATRRVTQCGGEAMPSQLPATAALCQQQEEKWEGRGRSPGKGAQGRKKSHGASVTFSHEG